MSHAVPSCPVCEIHAESVFRVEGMDCHEEVAILERRLKPLKGLEAMSADVVGGTLRVSHDAAQLSAAAIAEAVNGTGMRAWLDHDTASRITARPRDGRQPFLVASGVAVAAGMALGLVRGPSRRDGRAVCRVDCRGRLVLGEARVVGRPPVRPRHQRADAHRGCRGHRHRPVVRGGRGHLPVRAGAVDRVAEHGAGPPRHPGRDGTRAERGARAPRWPGRPRGGGHRGDWTTSSWSGPGRRSRSTVWWRPATARSTRRPSPASRCPSASGRATRCSRGPSTATGR